MRNEKIASAPKLVIEKSPIVMTSMPMSTSTPPPASWPFVTRTLGIATLLERATAGHASDALIFMCGDGGDRSFSWRRLGRAKSALASSSGSLATAARSVLSA